MEVMQLAQESPGAFSPAASGDWSSFTAWGPAAARVTVPLAGLQMWDSVRALSLLGSDPAHDPAALARITDAWLEPDTDTLLSSASMWSASTTPSWWDKLSPADPNPPLVWDSVNRFGVDNFIDSGPKNFLLTTVGPVASNSFPWGAGHVASSAFANGSNFATLALEAADDAGPPVPPATWRSQDFKATAALFGGGATGLLAGALTNAVGGGALLSLGVGAAAAGAALWFLTDRLDTGEYSSAWTALTEIPGRVVDEVVSWLNPGTDFATGRQAGAASTQLGYRATTNEPSIFDRVADGIIELFD